MSGGGGGFGYDIIIATTSKHAMVDGMGRFRKLLNSPQIVIRNTKRSRDEMKFRFPAF